MRGIVINGVKRQATGDGRTSAEGGGITCLACGASRFRPWFTKASSLDSRSYPIFKCAGCKSAFVIPRPAVSWIKRLLSPSGVTAIAVPHLGSMLSKVQAQSDMFITPPEYLNYFSYAGLVALFARHGLVRSESQTISRVNLTRVPKRIPLHFVSRPISLMVRGVLQFSDSFRRGMFLNLYFRHTPLSEPR